MVPDQAALLGPGVGMTVMGMGMMEEVVEMVMVVMVDKQLVVQDEVMHFFIFSE